jgi:hypothetical protein
MSNEQPDSPPKLHVDSGWKAEAQAEKERLVAAEEERRDATPAAEAPERGDLPAADFKALMGILASQAIMGLGSMTDPESGGVVVDLVGAKFAIDLLGVLEEKTKGNLEEDQEKELKQVLTELQARFVQIAQLVAAQGQASAPPAAGDQPPPTLEVPGL